MANLQRGNMLVSIVDTSLAVGTRPASVICAATEWTFTPNFTTETREEIPCDPMTPSTLETFQTARNYTLSITAIMAEHAGAGYNSLTFSKWIELLEEEKMPIWISEINPASPPNMHWYAPLVVTATGGSASGGRMKDSAPVNLEFSVNGFSSADFVYPGQTAGIPAAATLPLI